MNEITIKTTMTRAKIFIGETAPQVGIEPTTNWLTANCSTAELLWNTWYSLTKNVIVKWRIKNTALIKILLDFQPLLPTTSHAVFENQSEKFCCGGGFEKKC